MIKSIRQLINILLVWLTTVSLTACKDQAPDPLMDRIEQLEKDGQLIVQLAELEINTDYLQSYLELLEEGIRTSVNKEPGVLTLYAMADRDRPNRITVVEVYESQEAYEAHIQSPHFLKYKNGTLHMVDSLKLTRTSPIVFAAKK